MSVRSVGALATSSCRSADKGGRIDRVAPQFVVVGDSKRRQPRGVEQIAFDGALEHADLEKRFDADHDGGAERDEQRRRRRSESARRNFAPLGRRCAAATASRSGVAIVEVIAIGGFVSFYRWPGCWHRDCVQDWCPPGRGNWLDSPVDSSSCDAGGRFLSRLRRSPADRFARSNPEHVCG